jgi:hypothetical protein
MEIFTNRELASVTWIIVFFIYSFTKSNVRLSIVGLIKSFFQKKLIQYFVISLAYFVVLLIFLHQVLILDISQVKDSIIWFVVSGLVVTGDMINTKNTKEIIKSHFLENIKMTIIVEFIISTFVFPLIIELVLIPVIFIVAILELFSKKEDKYKAVNKLLVIIQMVLGIIVLGFSIISAVSDYQNLVGINSIKSFILPLILMTLYFPFTYAWLLYARYEVLFTKISVIYSNVKKPEIGKILKRETFKLCLFSYDRINDIDAMKYYFWHLIDDKEKIKDFIKANKKRFVMKPEYI